MPAGGQSQIQKQGFILAGIFALLTACGSNSKNDKTSTEAVSKASFSKVNIVLRQKCSESGCHSETNAGSVVLVDSQINYEIFKNEVKVRIAASDDRRMPPQTALPLDDTEKLILNSY